MQMQVTPIKAMTQPHSVIRDGVVTLTADQAQYVLVNYGYENNRDWTRAMKHVEVLAEQMRRGQWLDRSQIDFVSMPDGRLILVNGHHRMAAQSQANVTIRWQVTVRPCQDMSEVASIYARHDTNLRARTPANIMQAMGLAETCGITPGTAMALWRAAPIISNGMRAGKTDDDFLARNIADDRFKVATSYAAEARAYEYAIKRAPTKMKKKLTQSGSIAAVALVTFRANPVVAAKFWGGLADNDGLRRGDPRATLRDWMMNVSSIGTAGPAIFAAAKAWNYFHDNEGLTVIKMMGSPIRINGTPYVVAI
jgi:hypothetical protein